MKTEQIMDPWRLLASASIMAAFTIAGIIIGLLGIVGLAQDTGLPLTDKHLFMVAASIGILWGPAQFAVILQVKQGLKHKKLLCERRESGVGLSSP